MSIRHKIIILVAAGLLLFLVSACNKSSPTITPTPPQAQVTETKVIAPTSSDTPIPATPTPIPMAVIINGEGIPLAEFEAEVERFKASIPITGTNLASDPSTIVLNELIDQTLMAQSAAQNGFTMDDTLLQSKIETLEADLGGTQALDDWKSTHGYTDDDFIKALRRSVGAAWMRDQIIANVPETADEVHVLQILLTTSTVASEVYSLLQAGEDFLELASKYDPSTKGDLGWFPRGYLGEPAIEEAAFALQPGGYSSVIETEIGFHILYLVERDSNHLLQPEARRVLQRKAVQDWLIEQRDQSEIQILVP